MFYNKKFPFVFLAGLTISCSSNVEFSRMTPNGGLNNPPPAQNPIPPGGSGTTVYSLAMNHFVHQQDVYPQNKITAQFQVLDANNLTINGLGKDRFVVTENGLNVSNFNLSQQNVGIQKDADIVFVLDVTTSMTPYIDKVKQRVRSFVDALAKSNIRSRLCMVQMTDNVEKVCDKWVEDNPATGNNENFDDFMKKLKAISVHDGGSQVDEGQLAAFEAASQTPWHNGAQRVAILISDAGFHYSPGNADEGNYVPTYPHTLDMIRAAGMQTFIISIFKPGYDRDFGSLPSMTKATGGAFYNISDVLTGKTDMAEIFNNIAGNLLTTYTLDYSVDDNSNLDATLPFAQRNIRIFVDPTVKGTVKMSSIGSSLPNGHAALPNKFDVSTKEMWLKSVKIKVNGNLVTSGVSFNSHSVLFDKAPAQGSLLDVGYYHSTLRDDLMFNPVVFKSTNNIELKQLEVKANGVVLKNFQFEATLLDAKTLRLELKDTVFDADSDPFEIVKRGFLVLDYTLK